MKLNYRENFELITGLGIVCPISIQGKPVSLVLDTWSEGLVNLTEKDFNTWSTQYTKGTNQKVSNGYKEATQEEESLILPETMFVKTKIEDAMAVKNPYLKRSVLGKRYWTTESYPLTIFIRKFISSRLTWFLYRKRKLK